MAATLATGGVLSHRSAGALWGIRPWDGRIEITTAWRKSQRTGLLLHRAVPAGDEITGHDGISVTTPARTQLDLAGVLQRHQLQQAINEAPPTHTRSDLESRFHTFLDDRRFPRPQTSETADSPPPAGR